MVLLRQTKGEPLTHTEVDNNFEVLAVNIDVSRALIAEQDTRQGLIADDVATLQTSLANAEATIVTLQAAITALEARVTALETP